MSDDAKNEPESKTAPAKSRSPSPLVDRELLKPISARIQKTFAALGKQAAYWDAVHRSDASLVGLYTLTATLIMAWNMFHKENIRNVTGWVSFCVAASFLTIIATWLTGKRQWKEALEHKAKCHLYRAKYEELLRDLETRAKWTERRFGELNKKLGLLDIEADQYRITPPKMDRYTYKVILWLIVAAYICWEVFHLWPLTFWEES